MDDGINRRLICLILILILTGCSSYQGVAPVISGDSYVVEPNDTLYSIAWAYGFDYRDLARINSLAAPYSIHVGQKLRMYGQAKPKLRPVSRPIRSWVWPAAGPIIVRFSDKRGGNKGINIGGSLGEKIMASNSGVVVYSGSGLRAYGKLIIIKHNASILSAYAHNSRMLVKEGQKVHAGRQIATMGADNSGRAVLHFEIRINGRPVNPLNYLGKNHVR